MNQVKIKLLQIKDCPICERVIYDFNKQGKAIKLNKYGTEFHVLFSDGAKGKFAICKDCLKTLTKEQVDEIMKRQITTWGYEILKTYERQMSWYITKAVHLTINKFAEMEKELG